MTASASPVSIPVDPLPRDIDVTVLISRPQYETASDLSLLCFATPNVNFSPNNARVRTYMTFDSVIKDTGWTPADSGYWAAKAFFDQSVRPPRFAVGRVFDKPVPAQLMAPVITGFNALKAVTDGSFAVDLTDANGVVANLEVVDMDFSSITNQQIIVAAINAALSAGGQDGQLVVEIAYGNRNVLTDKTGGTAISYAVAGSAGTDASGLLNLTQAAGAHRQPLYRPVHRACQNSLSVFDFTDFASFCELKEASPLKFVFLYEI